MDLTIINQFMLNIDASITTGFGLIQGDVRFLFNALLVITIVLFGIYAAFSENNMIVSFFFKILYIGFFSYLVTNWQAICETVANTFTTLGLKAGGSQITLAQFMDPGAIASRGWNLTLTLLQYATDLSNGWGFATNIGPIAIYLVTALGILICFFIMAVQVFMAIISFKLVTLAAFILVPFGLWKGTGFLAERAVGYVFSTGIRLMVLALIVSLGQSLFGSITLNANPTTVEAAGALLGSLVFLVMCFYGPSLASDLITGGPSLGAGAAMATAIPTAIATAGAATAMTSAVTSLIKVVQRLSTQQKVSQVAQAAGAGMGGPGSPGYRPTPPSSGGGGGSGGSGGSAAASSGPRFTVEDAARHLRMPQGSGAGGAGAGGSGSGEASGQTLRGAGKAQPAPNSTSGKGGTFGAARQGSTRGFMEGVRSASRDGDGGGGMQASIKHPDEGG